MTNYTELIREFEEIMKSDNPDYIQENANVDGLSPMGHMMHFAASSSKHYTIENLLSEEVKTAYKEGYIHIHDLDFYSSGTTTCCQIPLGKLLEDGFNTGHGYMREPNSIMSAMALTSIILQANQNQQHGGQAIPMLDYDLAPYIKKTYEKHRMNLQNFIETKEELEKQAWEWTKKDTFQACEAFIHNCNSMNSRGGGQTPFVSVNLGTDTSKEGAMLTRCLLKAVQAGLGKGETPIFPIVVFKVKEGINYAPQDPNYALFDLALETTSKRLFPNFVFLDATFNSKYYDGTPQSEIATMGCRTRVMGNIHGKEQSVGRGNLSFTSINLPLLALETGSIEQFFIELQKYCQVVVRQLWERYRYQSTKKAANFKFLYTQGVWADGEKLKLDDHLAETLKQGTLSIGFVGLAECLVALLGVHHGESMDAYELGVQIVKKMQLYTDEATIEYGLNYSLIATPAESFAGKALRITKKKFGYIKGVTDREYFTNSFHIPVYYPIRALEKIQKEAVFHELTDGGHITYVELNGDASKNIDAVKTIVCAMKEAGIGYGSINHPVDRCLSCGYSGIINRDCPSCGEKMEQNIERIRRITGYLVGSLDKWNTAKRAEERERVKHQ
ncbi:anaerobic ribonucleoside triphosphate reductase [Niallia nealsonii]|uniref:Anaerobic ribonucleoside-triphosphate reductase n=1 Tax=Niallia nealsonii TaxID=115979 RepID=A0A2N0Z7T4_9BACI|nr:anaerobic ribonucleoside triphosphate reductase [Niallia nealsonii]PKG25576.1 anaerobic ribonucleoside-triphosphate reductase [Niallia nealsonii]